MAPDYVSVRQTSPQYDSTLVSSGDFDPASSFSVLGQKVSD
jgi:hypothetical protein